MNNNSYSEADKLQHEVEKLIEEVKALKKPYIKQPGNWFTLAGLVVSVAFNFSQCSDVKNTEQLARIEAASAKLAADTFSRKNQYLKIVGDSLVTVQQSLDQKINEEKKEQATLEAQISNMKNDLAKLQTTSAESAASKQVISNLSSSIHKIDSISQRIKIGFVKSTVNNLSVAQQKEREGFDHFFNGVYNDAIVSFIQSDNAYNHYNSVYEIANLVQKNRSALYADGTKKKEIAKIIVRQYSYGLTFDLLNRLKELAG